jgi:amidase
MGCSAQWGLTNWWGAAGTHSAFEGEWRTVSELLTTSVRDVARMIRQRDVSPVEVVQAHLDRIATVNPLINAVVALNADTALAEAHAAEMAVLRGDALGPLHGVPFTVKDTIETAGLVTTAGTLARQGYVPHADATAVARLRRAGAILLGKTNVPELAMTYTTDNLVYGRTCNPWNRDCTPGGSSGGEGAIIAAGGSPLGLGSDLGGSIRIPAHFCGIVGLKPTPGRVPSSGHVPLFPGPLGAMNQIGPLGRRISDLAVALAIIAGPDDRDPTTVPVPSGDCQALDSIQDRSTVPLRIAYYEDDGHTPVTAETRAAVRAAAQALAHHGMTVEEMRPPGLGRATEIWTALWAAYGGARTMLAAYLSAGTKVSPPLAKLMANVPPAMSSTEFVRSLQAVDELRRDLLQFTARYQLILCPVAAGPASPSAGRWIIEGQRLRGATGFV